MGILSSIANLIFRGNAAGSAMAEQINEQERLADATERACKHQQQFFGIADAFRHAHRSGEMDDAQYAAAVEYNCANFDRMRRQNRSNR